MKTNAEKLIYFLKRKDLNIHIDEEFQDQTKFYKKRFLTKCNCLCSTNQNQSIHSTLPKLRENIKICQYNKEYGIVVLNSEDCYSRFDHIIDDPTKFMEVNTDGKVHRIIAKENSINYHINKYLKLYDISITIKTVSTGSAPGTLYGIIEVHKQGNFARLVVSIIGAVESI